MYRPSPQVPKPSSRAARLCYESSEYIINFSSNQMDGSGVDITWVFLLTVNMALNTLLWTVSYPEVRQEHPRQDVEKLVDVALDVLGRCSERWPGTAAASQLYAIFSRACLQSYEARQIPGQQQNFFTTPPSFADPSSPPESYAQPANNQLPFLNPPQFGYVFDSPPESMNTYAMDPNFPPPQPSFRSNSIFFNPASIENSGRRFSYFPPDFTQMGDTSMDESTPPATTTPEQQHLTSPPSHMSDQLPTPPDSLPTGNMTTPTPSHTLSPPGTMSQQMGNMVHTSPIPAPTLAVPHALSPPMKPPPPINRVPNFAVQQTAHPAPPHQRPLPGPNAINNWFSPPPPFISPYAFGNMSTSIFSDTMANTGQYNDMTNSALGLQSLGVGTVTGPQFDYNTGRQGSLTQSQQMELMNVLETDGLGEIDAFLNGNTMPNSRWY